MTYILKLIHVYPGNTGAVDLPGHLLVRLFLSSVSGLFTLTVVAIMATNVVVLGSDICMQNTYITVPIFSW